MSEDLDQECKQVAHDARAVHEWLRPILAQSAAAKGGYAFKDRLKPWHEIKQKVLAKRNDPDPQKCKPNYQPSQITEASGLRIASLFNSEIPEVLDKLLSLFSIPVNDEKGRFKDHCVREIIFYSSRRAGDPLSIKKEVESIVDKHGLQSVYKVPQDDASSYSSVHVIIESECGTDASRVSACSEIQLRSVFEEAWSEINHRLVYAPTKRGKALESDPSQPVLPSAVGEWQLHLDALKSATDGCAQHADLIRRQFLDQQSEPATRRARKPTESAAKAIPAFGNCGGTVIKAVNNAFRLRDAADAMPSEHHDKGQSFADAAKAFTTALDALEADDIGKTRPDLHRQLLEEKAFCLMSSDNAELMGQAEQIFMNLVSDGEASYNAYLRYGQIKRRAGEFAEAKTLLGEALIRAKRDSGNEKALFVIGRNLGYVCWRIASLNPPGADPKALLEEAVEVTLEALPYAADDSHKANGWNNILYYFWDLARLDGESTDLTNRIRDTLSKLNGFLTPEKATNNELDTLMRSEHLYGDKARAHMIAGRLMKELRAKINAHPSADLRRMDPVDRLKTLSHDEQDMYLYAQEVLAEEAAPA